MNKQQRKLLIKFREENSALILACAQDISEAPETSPEEQKSARDIVELCKKMNQRDCSKYICQHSDGLRTETMGKGRIVIHVIRSYAEKEGCCYEQLKQAFSPRWLRDFCRADTQTRPKRYFISDDELIRLKSGEPLPSRANEVAQPRSSTLMSF